MNEDKKIKYTEIDIDALATALSEKDWEECTKMQPKDELWETVVEEVEGHWPYTGSDEIRQVKPYWASIFFSIRECYIKLINTYKKYPDTEQ